MMHKMALEEFYHVYNGVDSEKKKNQIEKMK